MFHYLSFSIGIDMIKSILACTFLFFMKRAHSVNH